MKIYMRKNWVVLFTICLLFTIFYLHSSPAYGKIVSNDYYIETVDSEIKVHLREVISDNTKEFTNENVILFLHGSTTPGPVIYDLPVEGYSWAKFMADNGFASYVLEVRGYGKSTRQPEMEVPASENRPIARAMDAIKDIDAAVNFIMKKRGVESISLLGWSWGCLTAGLYSSLFPEKINKLILYAPVYKIHPGISTKLSDKSFKYQFIKSIGAYTYLTGESIQAGWDAQIAVDDKAKWRTPEVLNAWLAGCLASDPTSKNRTPPSYRNPMGCYYDAWYTCTIARTFDASKITSPVLIVRGENDGSVTRDDSFAILRDLTKAKYKRFIEFDESTHFMALERKHKHLWNEVLNFLANG
jgi:pimeloyl-ACP methyl ester carboxylesterase